MRPVDARSPPATPSGGAGPAASPGAPAGPAAAATADAVVDARGLKCPEPLMVVRGAVRQLSSGGTLHVVATDPSTTRDIPSYCRFLEHELLHQWQAADEYHFVLRKGLR